MILTFHLLGFKLASLLKIKHYALDITNPSIRFSGNGYL